MRSTRADRFCRARALTLVATLAACVLGAASAATPQRIVSINICGDLLALSLAPREHIASITFLASDPVISPMYERAAGIPQNYGQAEEVLAHDPDLVIAGRYTARATVNLLERLGYPVLELDIARSVDDVRAQIRAAAHAFGVEASGEAMIGALDARIAAAGAGAHEDAPAPVAAIYGPNGYTLGPKSLSGALVRIAGFENLATRSGIESVGHLPLETLLLAEPDLLVAESEHSAAPSMATQILAHPAMQRLRQRTRVVEIPRALWSCPGPWLAEALDRLARARASLDGRTLR